jgi:tetratricopeptide (TPR) repeat protein
MALTARLHSLESAGLIELFKTQPELEYQFRHSLVQETAYGSLLKRDRQALHLSIGEALESAYPDQLDRRAALLAHHFAEAEDVERALKYYALAGDVAARAYANAEAIHHYGHAIELAHRVSLPAQQLIDLYTRRGRALELQSDYDAALAGYRELEMLAHRRNDKAMELAALLEQATIFSTPTTKLDVQQGQSLSEHALALARQLGDKSGEAKALWNLMLLASYALDDPRQAVAYGEQALAIAREHGSREQLAYILHDIVRPYATIGQFAFAWGILEESQNLWRELGNLPMLADSLATRAEGEVYLGHFDRAIASAREAVDITRSINNVWGQANALGPLARAHAERGDVSDAIAAWSSSIVLGELAGFTAPAVYDRAQLALLFGRLGEFERAFQLLHEIPQQPPDLGGRRGPMFPIAVEAWLRLKSGEHVKACETLRSRKLDWSLLEADFIVYAAAGALVGEVELACGDIQRARALAESGINILQSAGVRAFLPDLLHIKGRALLAAGEVDVGYAVLAEARSSAERMHSRYALLSILGTLVRLEFKSNDALDDLRQQAREVIDYIVRRIDEPDLHASFMNLPDVRAVLQD